MDAPDLALDANAVAEVVVELRDGNALGGFDLGLRLGFSRF
jgi:hypothetical protein